MSLAFSVLKEYSPLETLAGFSKQAVKRFRYLCISWNKMAIVMKDPKIV